MQNLPRAPLLVAMTDGGDDGEEKNVCITVRDAFESRPGDELMLIKY